MIVEYAIDSGPIRYDSGSTDYMERQRLVIEIAQQLLRSQGELSLRGGFENVSIVCNLNTGHIEVVAKKGAVDNSFSFDSSIKEPVVDAIKLIAQYELLKELTKIDNHADVKRLIQKHIPDFSQLSNLSKVNIILMEIHYSQSQPLFRIFTTNNPSSIDRIISEVMQNKVTCKNDVDRIFPKRPSNNVNESTPGI